ncbi:MAG: DUF4249 family protein [Bacteroidota bacterium]
MKTQYLLPLLLLAACSQPIQMDLGDEGGKLVVHGLLEADSVAEVILTESKSYYGWLEDDLSLLYQEDLSPVLRWEGGEETLKGSWGWKYTPQSFGAIDTSRVFRYRGTTPLESGNTYELVIEEEEQTIQGTTTIPGQPTIRRAIVEEQVETFPDGGTFRQEVVLVEFEDVRGEENTYGISFQYSYWEYDYDYDFNTNTYSVVDSNYRTTYRRTQALLEETQDGSVEEISLPFGFFPYRFGVTEPDTFEFEVNIVLETYDRAYGTYLNSAFAQQAARFDPFSEPVLLNGNLEPALGIIGSAIHSDTISYIYEVVY